MKKEPKKRPDMACVIRLSRVQRLLGARYTDEPDLWKELLPPPPRRFLQSKNPELSEKPAAREKKRFQHATDSLDETLGIIDIVERVTRPKETIRSAR